MSPEERRAKGLYGAAGRPRKPAESARTVRVHVHLTPDEAQQLAALAAQNRLTVSDWIRLCAITLPQQRTAIVEETPEGD